MQPTSTDTLPGISTILVSISHISDQSRYQDAFWPVRDHIQHGPKGWCLVQHPCKAPVQFIANKRKEVEQDTLQRLMQWYSESVNSTCHSYVSCEQWDRNITIPSLLKSEIYQKQNDVSNIFGTHRWDLVCTKTRCRVVERIRLVPCCFNERVKNWSINLSNTCPRLCAWFVNVLQHKTIYFDRELCVCKKLQRKSQ